MSSSLTISYNNNTIKSVTTSTSFKLTTKGKFMADDLTIAATITEAAIIDANAVAADIRSGVVAYINNGSITGTMANYGGSVTIAQVGPSLITFTIDNIEYQAEDGMLWGYWVDSEYNTGNYDIFFNDVQGVFIRGYDGEEYYAISLNNTLINPSDNIIATDYDISYDLDRKN